MLRKHINLIKDLFIPRLPSLVNEGISKAVNGIAALSRLP